MSDVFLSYAREDSDFVRTLHDALEAGGHESWVDWEGIPPSAEWMAEIRRAIEGANAFVFVISPDSVRSKVCRAEVGHAESAGKRIVPVVRIEPESSPVPEALARLNWVFIRPGDPFGPAVATLVEALDTDLDHVRTHTRVLVRARGWTDNDEDPSHLLRGRDLEAAERWLEGSEGKDPPVTPAQSRYLLESRRAQARRQRRTLAGVALALVVSTVLGTLAWVQRNEAERQRRLAVARALATQSELVAEEGGPGLVAGTLLAVESLRASGTDEGRAAWRRRLALLPRAPLVESPPLGDTRAGTFTDDRTLWAAGTEAGEVVVGDVETGRVRRRWQAVASPVRSLAFSPDGTWLAVGARQELAVWDLAARESLARFDELGSRLDVFGQVHDLRFSREGNWLYAAAEGFGVEVIATDTWTREPPIRFDESRVFALDRHPNGDLLAVGGFGWGTVDPPDGRVRMIPDPRREEISTLRFSPSGYELAVADLAVRVWDLEPAAGGAWTAQPADRLTVTDDRVHDLAFDRGGRYLAVAREEGMVQVLEAKAGAEIQRLPVSSPVRGVALGGDDTSLLTVGDRFRAHPAPTRHERHRRVLEAAVDRAFFAGDGRWLVVETVDGWARVLDPDGLAEQARLDVGRGTVTAVSPDGRWLAAGGSDRIVVLEAASLDRPAPDGPPPGAGSPELHFDPTSRYLLATGAEVASVLDLRTSTWSDLRGPAEPGRAGWRAWFTGDGAWLVLTTRDGSRLVRAGSWDASRSLTEGRVVALSPDRTLVCTHTEALRARRSSMLHVWRLDTGEKVGWGPEPGGIRVDGVAEERGGDGVLVEACSGWPPLEPMAAPADPPASSEAWVVGAEGSTVSVYPLAVPEMIAEACDRLPRNFTVEEWGRFMPDTEYRATCPSLPLPVPDTLEGG